MTEPERSAFPVILLIFVLKRGDEVDAGLMSASLKFRVEKYLDKLERFALADNPVAHA